MKKLYIGAAYYPELWDEAEVDKDIERCKELGLNVMRVGEFAWGRMEPREGEYDFSWLLSVVDKLYAAGIYTVMCTPTCTPPRYMLDKYEEMRNVSEYGVRSETSWRCHPCKTSPKMREKNRAIVTQMAKTFGQHPGIIGWQIDNELYPYGGGCYCPLCVSSFRKVLKDRFGTIGKLNKAWGMSRWSLDYQSFEAVNPPKPDQWKHPSLVKAWWDFQCENIFSYVDEQAEILHKYTKVPIGTDMMANNNLSYYETNRSLDVVQFNHYNTAAELYETEFWYDFFRPVKDIPFWVTETQVGWNGGEFAQNGYRAEGNCYVNTWLPFAHGGEMNMYWLFRAHKNGHELAHGALYSTAGRVYRVSEEVKKAAEELAKCEEILDGSKVNADIALHYSSTAANTFAAAPLLKNLDYTATVRDKFYTALRHYNVDVIDTAHPLDKYKVVISPFLCHAQENGFYERITEFVKRGGVWIVGPMSDIVDGNVTKYDDAPHSFLEQLAGVYTKYQKPVDNDVFRAEWSDGSPCGVSMCFDAYELKGAESLAKYSVGEFKNLCVIASRNVGAGKVILLGSVPTHDDLRRLVGLKPIMEASGNITLVKREGKKPAIIAVELENSKGFIQLDGKYRNAITGTVLSGRTEVAPYTVLVLEKVK